MPIPFKIFALLFFFPFFNEAVSAEEVRVAVAANFTPTLKEIALHFDQDTGHTTLISSGSSGKFFAQIKHGAPFDVFFSADVTRPQLMEEEGLAVPGSHFTYAIGQLTLWSHDPSMIASNGVSTLLKGPFEHLAIANPKTAPYGQAAQQTLVALGLWNQVKERLVQGENIGQTFHFVFSNNAQLGFVARAQVMDPKINGIGSHWDVPEDLYEPLRQQAVLLIQGQQNEAAKAFLRYVKGAKARSIIKKFGYGLEN